MRGLDRVHETVRQAHGDLTGEEVANQLAALVEGRRPDIAPGVILVTELLCLTCGQRVAVHELGLLAKTVVAAMSLAGHEPTVFRLAADSQSAADALNRLWSANRREHGVCGHVVTVDASAESAAPAECP